MENVRYLYMSNEYRYGVEGGGDMGLGVCMYVCIEGKKGCKEDEEEVEDASSVLIHGLFHPSYLPTTYIIIIDDTYHSFSVAGPDDTIPTSFFLTQCNPNPNLNFPGEKEKPRALFILSYFHICYRLRDEMV